MYTNKSYLIDVDSLPLPEAFSDTIKFETLENTAPARAERNTNEAFFYSQSPTTNTISKQRCSSSVLRLSFSSRAINMWNYLPVNTTNFSSRSNYNKAVYP